MIDHKEWDCLREGIQLRFGNNVQGTQALFVEFNNEDAPYTLKPHDVSKGDKTYISAYQVFMNSVDEGEAALKLVGSYGHWRKLCNLKWFKEGITEYGFEGLNQWRADMQTRDKTTAKRRLIQAAESGNVPAQRYLYELGGKPTKAKAKTEEVAGFSIDPSKVLKELNGGRDG